MPESFRGGCSFGAGHGMVRTLPLTTGVEDRGGGGVVKVGGAFGQFDHERLEVKKQAIRWN